MLMNRVPKVLIFVVLLVVVGIVIAVKQGRRLQQPGRPAGPVSSLDEFQNNKAQPETHLPQLIDLGADKCIPCKMMAPILAELKKEYAGTLEVTFFDVWKEPDFARQYGIRIIPTQIFIDASGKELFRHQGFMSKEDILDKWKQLGVDIEKGVKDEAIK